MDINANVTNNGRRSSNSKDLRVRICRTCVEMKQIRDLEYRECRVLERMVAEREESYVEKGMLLSDAFKEVDFLREIWASLGNGDAAKSSPQFDDTEGTQQSPTSPKDGREVGSDRKEASEYLGVAPVKKKKMKEHEDEDDDDGVNYDDVDDESDIQSASKRLKQNDDDDDDDDDVNYDDDDDESEIPAVHKRQKRNLKDDEDEDSEDEMENERVDDKKTDASNENRSCYQLCRWLTADKGTVTKCRKVCTNTELQDHIAKEHLTVAEHDSAVYVCLWEDCEVTEGFDTKRELLLHVSQHAFDKKYRCTVHNCGRLFASKADLDEHKSSHVCRRHFIMRQRCEDCGVRFVHKSSLSAHREFHLCGDVEGDVHRCPYKDCGKVFANAKRLLKHKRSHVGEAYSCKEPGCGSVFSCMKNMSIHFAMVHKFDS